MSSSIIDRPYLPRLRISTSAFSRTASDGLATTTSPGASPETTSSSDPRSWPMRICAQVNAMVRRDHGHARTLAAQCQHVAGDQ